MRKPLIAASIGAILLAAGCSSTPSDSGGAPRTTEVRVAMAQVPYGPSLDPMLTTYLDPEVTNLFNTLTMLDSTGKVVPDVATSWKNLNPTTWQFTLRTGIKFHNGDPLSADDVKYSWDRIADPANKSPAKAIYTGIASVEVVDATTVNVVTTAANAAVPAAVATLRIVPSKLIKSIGNEEFAKKPIGSGPFKFESWTVGSQIVETANTEYWGGAPSASKITYLKVPEASTRKAMLLSGQVDLAEKLLNTDVAGIEANPDLKIMKYASNYTDFVSINAMKPPFNDVRVRQAVSYAVDVDTIIDKVIGKTGVRVAIQNSSLNVGSDKSLTPYKYDPAKAKSLLADAGFNGNFPEQVLDVGTGRQPYNVDVAQAIAGYLTDAGIPTKVNVMESAALFTRYLSKDAGLIYMGTRTGTADSDNNFSVFFTSMGRGLYWNTPEVDNLVVQARGEFDPVKRNALYAQVSKLIYDAAPVLPLYDEISVYGARKNLEWAGPGPDVSMPFWSLKLT